MDKTNKCQCLLKTGERKGKKCGARTPTKYCGRHRVCTTTSPPNKCQCRLKTGARKGQKCDAQTPTKYCGRHRKCTTASPQPVSARETQAHSPVIVRSKSSPITRSHLPLKDHQKLVVRHMRKHRGLLVIHGVGSGKTLTAVTVGEAFLHDYSKGKVIVVTPKSLQTNFKKEMVRYDPNIDTSKYHFYTYSSFSNAYQRKEIDCRNSLLIIDEAHNLRNIKGTRTVDVMDCASPYGAKKVLLLTATPIVNEPYDLMSLLRILGATDGMSKQSFKDIIENPYALGEHFKCKVSIYEPNFKEVKEFYPKKIINEVFIKMPSAYERAYMDVERHVAQSHWNSLFSNPSVFYNGLRRAANKLEGLESPKLKWINKFFSSHDSGKVVIFSNWLEYGIEACIDLLKRRGISFRHIDGSMSIKERQESVTLYNEGDIRVLLISRAGAEGLDLKETRDMILIDPGWNPAGVEQIIGRGIRYKSHINLPKSEQVVNVYKLYVVKKEELLGIKQHHYDDMANRKKSEDIWSIDLYMRALAMQKQKIIDKTISNLKPLSIEETHC